MQFRNGFKVYIRRLTLGEDLTVIYNEYGGKVKQSCRFVKVTEKGFNILDLITNRMILKNHLYAIDMGGKQFPSIGPITAKFRIPSYITLLTQKTVESAS